MLQSQTVQQSMSGRLPLYDDFQVQLNAASISSWRNIIVTRIVFLESPMFYRKYMVDAAVKPRQLTSTGKTLLDQLLEQEKVDLEWLDVSKVSPAKFYFLFHLPTYTKYSALQSQLLTLTSFFHR